MNVPHRFAVSFSGDSPQQAVARYRIDAPTLILKVDRSRMETSDSENSALVKNSVLYKEFLAEREEILRHKWIESEKAGHDIGFEKALLDWIVRYRSAWRDKRHRQVQPS